MQNIYKYIFSFCLLFVVISSVFGEKTEENDSIVKKKLFNGLRVDLDIAPLVTSFINKGNALSYEAAIQTELLERYYPVFELGFGSANKTTSSDINFKGSALFYRIGLDFNLIKNKKEQIYKNYFLVGARLAHNYMHYNLNNMLINPGYWSDSQTNSYKLQQSNFWFEIAAGLRVEIFKNTYLGWNIRFRNLINKNKPGEFIPLYIPGYGINKEGSVWGFNYLIGYKL